MPCRHVLVRDDEGAARLAELHDLLAGRGQDAGAHHDVVSAPCQVDAQAFAAHEVIFSIVPASWLTICWTIASWGPPLDSTVMFASA